MSWWDDVLKWAWSQPTIGQEIGVQPGSTAPATAVTNAAGGAAGITAIWTNLRDYKMWRSLGWLFLGVLLMFLGVSWWLGPSSQMGTPGAGALRRLL